MNSSVTSIDPADATRIQTEMAILEWRKAREERLDADKVAAALKKTENELAQWLINVFQTQKYEGMVIDGKITGVTPKEIPACNDRGALQDYILKTGALELLEFRLSKAAINERVAFGEEIPGIEFVEVYSLFNRKA